MKELRSFEGREFKRRVRRHFLLEFSWVPVKIVPLECIQLGVEAQQAMFPLLHDLIVKLANNFPVVCFDFSLHVTKQIASRVMLLVRKALVFQKMHVGSEEI